MHQSANRIWIGGVGGGLAVFENDQFKLYANDRRFAEININTLAEDRTGNLWIGTHTNGVWKLARNQFTNWDMTDGLSRYVNSVFQTKAGEICVTGDGYLISRFTGERFVSVRPNLPARIEDRGWRTYRGIIEDHNGEWWIGTDSGLFRFPRVRRIEELAKVSPLTAYSTRDGLATGNVGNLFEDSRGDIWIGSFGAQSDVVTRWERASGTFHRYGESAGLRLAETAVAFCEDRDGNIWIRFFSGNIARYSSGRFLMLAAPDGKPLNGSGGMYRDQKGQLWISTISGSLGQIENPEATPPVFTAWFEKDKLTRGSLYSINSDNKGHLYIATRRLTLARFDPQTGRIKQFTAADGFAPVEIRNVFRDREGVLWLTTLTGLIRFVPTADPPSEPPPALISELSIGGIEYQVPGLGASALKTPELESDQNQLSIGFFGLSFASGEVLRYQFKLEGADRDWSAPAETGSVNYANLAPGFYRFLVRATSVDGSVSDIPASVEFRILPPFWRRWWFLSLLGTTIIAAGYLLYRYRVNQLLEIERVRMRIATDLHDDIGAGLSRISILSEVIRQRIGTGDLRVGQQISSISGASQELVDSMSDIVWAINPQKEHLTDLAHRCRRFASDVLASRNIRFKFNAPDEGHDLRLGAELRREVYLIFKEAVNNLARHSRATEAEIELLADRRCLTLRVADNGRGFDATAVAQGNLEADGDGNGLTSMCMRAKRMGGELQIESADGQGTALSLRVPLNQRNWLEKSLTENPRLRHRYRKPNSH